MIRPFGLEPGEGRSAGLMGLHSFAMGLSTVFFETAASALFVSRFGPETLPWAYIAAAGMNAGVGAAFQAARARLHFRTAMASLLGFLLLSVAGLRLWTGLSEAAGLVFSLFAFYRVLSVLTDLEYWAVAGRLYDVRQAKRLYPLIGTGEVVARIAGSFAVPLLVSRFDVLALLWLSAAALFACLLLLLQVLPGGQGSELGAVVQRGTGARAGFLAAFRDSYLQQLVALAFFGVLAKFLVDYAFLAEMRAHTADVAGFATFFGVFSGLTQVLSLLTRVLVAGPFLARFGIQAGLLVLPLLHSACTAAILLADFVPGAGGFVFWLVVANQGIYKVLKHPIDNPCAKLLYQPLLPRDRLTAQVAVETTVTPLTTGLAGVVMLLFASSHGFDATAFAWLLLAVFLPWAGAALRAGRRYGGALVGALQERIVHVAALDLRDDASRRALDAALASPRPADVLFALDLLLRADPARAARKLLELAVHPAGEVRRAAFAHLQRSGGPGAAAFVARRLASEPRAEVRAAAIDALVALQGRAAEPFLAAFLLDADPRVRAGALAALLAWGGASSPRRAELLRWAAAPASPDRLAAALAMAASPRGAFDGTLTGLLGDPVREVRQAAFQAAARAGGPEVFEALLRMLENRRFSHAAVRALRAGGEAVVPFLAPALEGTRDPYVLRRLLTLAAALPGEAARALVAERAFAEAALVRQAALVALAGAGHCFPESERPRLLESLRREAWHAAAALAAAKDLGDAPAFAPVRAALVREADLARERALLLLSCTRDRAALQRAHAALRWPDKGKRALALEALDVTLAAEERALLLPLCEAGERRVAALEALYPQEPQLAQDRLRALVRGAFPVRPFARACALLATASANLSELLPEVEAAAGPGPPFLVQQTAAYACAALSDGKEAQAERRQRPMLAIERVIALKGAPMFAEASEDVLTEVADLLEEVVVPAGQEVFRKGDAGDSLYLVAEGRMRVLDGEHSVALLGAGEVFGELALLDPEPRLFTVAAVEDARLLRLDREAFLELMAGNIEIVRGILHVLCGRLRRAEAAIADDGRA